MREFTKEFLDTQRKLNENGRASLTLGGVRDKWYISAERLIVKEVAMHRKGYYMEHLVEIFGSHLSAYLNINAVHQELCSIRYPTGITSAGVYSKNFRNRGEVSMPMEQLLESIGVTLTAYTRLQEWDKITTTISALSNRIGKESAFKHMSDMCLIDYLIGNPDRHVRNYGLIETIDKRSGVRTWRPMPLFDFGQGLLSVNLNVDEFTSLELYPAYMVINSSAIAFDVMYEYFEEHWRYALRHVSYSGFPVSVLQGIHPQGVNYFVEACRTLGVAVL